MITAYKTMDGALSSVDISEPNNWINLVNPSKQDLETVAEKTGALLEFLEAPLDPEERSRIDTEDEQTLIIINVPIEVDEGENQTSYDTIPLGLLIIENHFITISLEDVDVLEDFINRPLRSTSTFKKTRFALQIFYKTATYFLKFLKQLDRKTNEIERSLHRAMKNERLIKLLGLEKSLVYFVTSLKANEIVMRKIFRVNLLPMYEEDEDLLEDVLTEINQAIDMAEINTNILSGMMDAFASIISNNLNVVMKILTSITIILTIPTMIFSFYGMNVSLPGADWSFTGLIIVIVTVIIAAVTLYIMRKKNMF